MHFDTFVKYRMNLNRIVQQVEKPGLRNQAQKPDICCHGAHCFVVLHEKVSFVTSCLFCLVHFGEEHGWGENNLHDGLHSLNQISIYCAQLTAKCNTLTSDWLGVLRSLCCSSNHNSGFIDVLTQIDVSVEPRGNGIVFCLMICHCLSCKLYDTCCSAMCRSRMVWFHQGISWKSSKLLQLCFWFWWLYL